MTNLRIPQMLAAALLLGSPAFAGPIGNSSGPAEATIVAQTKGPAAANPGDPGMSGNKNVPMESSGPATGTSVKPSTAPAAGGSPGQPGMPGNKSGPPAKPSDQKTK
jgi:hypothetical protein